MFSAGAVRRVAVYRCCLRPAADRNRLQNNDLIEVCRLLATADCKKTRAAQKAFHKYHSSLENCSSQLRRPIAVTSRKLIPAQQHTYLPFKLPTIWVLSSRGDDVGMERAEE